MRRSLENILAADAVTEDLKYRAVVLRHSGAELLVVPTHHGLGLPSAEVPRHERVAENLTRTFSKNYTCRVVCLFTPHIILSDAIPIHAQVMECWRSPLTNERQAVWLPVSSLSANSFADSQDHLVVSQALGQLAQPTGSDSEPFRKIGWFQELRCWVEEMIAPLGLRLTEEFRQLNSSASFSLIRFETTGSPVWFKAVGVPNQHEFPITLTLAHRFPCYLPSLIASRPAWRGWLMQHGGTAVAEMVPTLEDWRRVLIDLACLQIESMPHSKELLQAGSRDLRISSLIDLVDPFIDAMRPLMLEQRTLSPAPLSAVELLRLGMAIKGALAALDQVAVPVTLGHGDFNPGNMLNDGSASVFIDWAEAYVGHPFFTFEYLLSHLQRDWPEANTLEPFLRSAYAQPWKHAIPAQSIAEAFVFSSFAAVFAYATTFCRSAKAQDPSSAGYLRALTRRMKREADRLEARRVSCSQG